MKKKQSCQNCQKLKSQLAEAKEQTEATKGFVRAYKKEWEDQTVKCKELSRLLQISVLGRGDDVIELISTQSELSFVRKRLHWIIALVLTLVVITALRAIL